MSCRRERALRISICLSLLSLTLAAPTQSHAATKTEASPAEVRVAKGAASEQFERDVDMAALSSQEKAISRLHSLLKKYEGTSQEPVLLSKLGELQQEECAILFRIAHGMANRSGKALDLSRFKKATKDTIKTLNTLIAKYPSYEEIGHAHFLRGKSYEELEDKEDASKDYLILVNQFPNSDEVPSAYMSLADFAIEANDHPRAIGYLKEVEKRPDDPRYPFALYKLAWSHYNLKKIPDALSYAERQIAYYNAKDKGSDGSDPENLVTSDDALKENTLLDTAVFFFEGYEEKLPQYRLSEAYPYFKKLDDSPTLGKILLRFAKLLRSHEYEDDLVAWKDLVLAKEPKRPEALDVAIVTYEHQLNLRRYTKLVETAHDLVKLYKDGRTYESWPHAQKLLLDTAEGLQQAVVKNKNVDGVQAISVTLAAIYDSFTKVVDESDPRIPRVHYNLAETQFAIKDYTGATANYRWVVDHGSSSSWTKLDKEASVPDASLKALASRYEVLTQKQLIPKQLNPVSLKKDNPDAKLDPLLAEWIEWLDAHVKHTKKDTDNFAFEANRSLYAAGRITESLDRLRKFASENPASTFAIPSATLVVDTAIATEDWEKTLDLTHDLLKVTAWKNTDFSKHLFAVAADAAYKQVEAKHRANDFPGTIELADKFLATYASSARLGDALTLAGGSAMAIGDKAKAITYFTRLIKEVPKSAAATSAFLARAGMEEDRYQFADAAADYRTYLQLPPDLLKIDDKTANGLRKKILILTWLSGDVIELKATLDNKAVCTDAVASECEKYSILVALQNPAKSHDENVTADAFDKARHDSSENKALWAALALENSRALAFRDRLITVRALADGWDDLDPLVKYTLIPVISQSIPTAFRQNRAMMGEVAPLRADERYITRRVEVIHEVENAAAKVMKLPWSRVRAETLNEVASLYLDLSHALTVIKPPKGLEDKDLEIYNETIRKLTMPFEEKGQDMRGKAFEIASQFAVENESFAAISEPFFSENPSQAKALKPNVKPAQPTPIDLAFLNRIDSSSDWGKLSALKGEKTADIKEPSKYLKALWAQAVAHKNWQQIAFFMQEAHDKALIQAGTLGAVKAVSLSMAGAKGEALAELEDARRDMQPDAKVYVASTLLQHYSWTYAKDKMQALTKELHPDLVPVSPRAPAQATPKNAAKPGTQKTAAEDDSAGKVAKN